MTGRTRPTLFETERLLVHALGPEDLPAMCAVYGDAESMRHVGDGEPLDEATCARWIVLTERNRRERGYGMSTVIERDGGRTVGFCGIVHPRVDGRPQREPELKYAIERSSWGRGYATEVARGMVRHALDAHALDRIIATVDAGHDASTRVLAKVGFRHVATRRDDDGGVPVEVHEWRAVPDESGQSLDCCG